jgi:hypothetical protein
MLLRILARERRPGTRRLDYASHLGREAQVRQPQGEGILIPTKKYSLAASMAERSEIVSEWALIYKEYQRTLSQRVQGSSPYALTREIKHLVL